LDTLLVRLLFPITAEGFAEHYEGLRVGLARLSAPPRWARAVLAPPAFSMARFSRAWRVHALPPLRCPVLSPHSDPDIDVTTGGRFHPIESLLSMAIKLAAIAALGAPALAVLLFEILLSATSMFNHGNVRMPRRLDWVLRWIVVTPDMHRVHHSA